MEVKNYITCVTHEDIENAAFYIVFPEYDGDSSDSEIESIEEYIIVEIIDEEITKPVSVQRRVPQSLTANGSPVSPRKSLASVIQTAVSRCQPRAASPSSSRQTTANGLRPTNKSRQTAISNKVANNNCDAVSKSQTVCKTRDPIVQPRPACPALSRQIHTNGLFSSNNSRQKMNTNKAGIKDDNNNNVVPCSRRIYANGPFSSNKSKNQAVPVRPSSSCPI